MLSKDEDFLAMKDVIEYAKIGRAAVYAAIKKGRIKAEKHGNFWKVSRQEIDRYRINKYNRDEREINGERIFSVEKGTFSVPQVAKIIHVELKIPYNVQRVYHLIRTGQLKCSKCGATFIVKREHLIKLIELERNVKNEDYRQFKLVNMS